MPRPAARRKTAGLLWCSLLLACAPLAAQDVPFETRFLKGRFHFLDARGQHDGPAKADMPGVADCVYKPLNAPLVNKTWPNSLLLPEWILKPGGPRDGALWQRAFFVRPAPVRRGVRVAYPHHDLQAAGLRCTLTYRVVDDMILLDADIQAVRRLENFELFFASYIPNRLETTYAPRRAGAALEWVLIPARKLPWKSVYLLSSSSETRRWRRDGRVADAKELGDWSEVYDPEWSFAAPILVASETSSGLAAVHFVDDQCSVLAGQHHPNDTAHDFAWGWPVLERGQRIHARAALWISVLKGSHGQRMAQVYRRYERWRRSPVSRPSD